jgi:hypothetical protein
MQTTEHVRDRNFSTEMTTAGELSMISSAELQSPFGQLGAVKLCVSKRDKLPGILLKE